MLEKNEELLANVGDELQQFYRGLEDTISSCKDPKMEQELNKWKNSLTIIFKNMMACKASIQESKSCFKKELASFKDIKEVPSNYIETTVQEEEKSQIGGIDALQHDKEADIYKEKKEKCSKELKSLIKEITKEFKDYQGLENSAKYLKHISKKMDDTASNKLDKYLKKAREEFENVFDQQYEVVDQLRNDLQENDGSFVEKICEILKKGFKGKKNEDPLEFFKPLYESVRNVANTIDTALKRINKNLANNDSDTADEISKYFDQLFNSLTELEGISVGGIEANSAQAADLSEITEKNEELARQVEDYEKEKQELMKEISGLQATNKTMTKKLDDSTKMQGALDKRLTELEKKSKESQDKEEQARKEVVQLKEKLEKMEEEKSKLEDEIKGSQDEIAQLLADQEEAKKTVLEQNEKLQEYKEKNKKLKKDKKKLAEEYNELVEQMPNGELEQEGSEEELQEEDEQEDQQEQQQEQSQDEEIKVEEDEKVEEQPQQYEEAEGELEAEGEEEELKEVSFKINKTKIFIQNQHPLNTEAQIISVPLSTSWKFKSELSSVIISEAGSEIKEVIREIREENPSPEIGCIEVIEGGELEQYLLAIACPREDEANEGDASSKVKIPFNNMLEEFKIQTDFKSICVPILIYTHEIEEKNLDLIVKEYAKCLHQFTTENPKLKKEIYFCVEDENEYNKLATLEEEIAKVKSMPADPEVPIGRGLSDDESDED